MDISTQAALSGNISSVHYSSNHLGTADNVLAARLGSYWRMELAQSGGFVKISFMAKARLTNTPCSPALRKTSVRAADDGSSCVMRYGICL